MAAVKKRTAVVRMYNVGFGDAFLVKLPTAKGERTLLFDCGSIEAAPHRKMGDVVKQIVSDVTGSKGPRIDVVVCTHRHKDHVSGFGDPLWQKVDVGEVWMPWTEHPTDQEARRIRNVQSRLALALQQAFALRAPALGAAERKELGRYQALVENALMLSNEKAMTTLHSGFSGSALRRFLPSKRKAERSFATDMLPGVRIHVLGPSRDPEVVRDMDPPKGQSYLRLNASLSQSAAAPKPPFSHEFIQSEYGGSGAFPPEDRGAIEKSSGLSDLAVAVALDKAVNGTSLMIVLEIAGVHLLFPGDAQWGTWEAAMKDSEWSDLLGRVRFYKIGHHGSHNATPKRFVEDMIPDGVWSMASTLERDVWPDIPKEGILEGLKRKRAKIARSDADDVPKDFYGKEGVVLEARIPL